MIKRFPVTGYFVLSQQWKCNIFNSKSYLKKTLLKLFLKVYFKGFDQKLQNILKVILLCCIFFCYLLIMARKITMEYVLLFCNVVFFLLFTYYGEQKNFTMEYVPILSYNYSEKRKTQRFYVIDYVKLKIYFLF